MIRYICPTCRSPFDIERREDAPNRPFCSERCRLIDLGKWFNGEYVISDPLPIGEEWDEESADAEP